MNERDHFRKHLQDKILIGDFFASVDLEPGENLPTFLLGFLGLVGNNIVSRGLVAVLGWTVIRRDSEDLLCHLDHAPSHTETVLSGLDLAVM